MAETRQTRSRWITWNGEKFLKVKNKIVKKSFHTILPKKNQIRKFFHTKHKPRLKTAVSKTDHSVLLGNFCQAQKKQISKPIASDFQSRYSYETQLLPPPRRKQKKGKTEISSPDTRYDQGVEVLIRRRDSVEMLDKVTVEPDIGVLTTNPQLPALLAENGELWKQ